MPKHFCCGYGLALVLLELDSILLENTQATPKSALPLPLPLQRASMRPRKLTCSQARSNRDSKASDRRCDCFAGQDIWHTFKMAHPSLQQVALTRTNLANLLIGKEEGAKGEGRLDFTLILVSFRSTPWDRGNSDYLKLGPKALRDSQSLAVLPG